MQEPTEDQGRSAVSEPPRLTLTTADDDSISRSPLARHRSNTVGSSSKAVKTEWYNLDSPATPARRKRRATQSKSSPSKSRTRSSTESSFFPKLARILDSGDSSLISRSGTKGHHSRHRRDRSPTRIRRARDDGGHKRSPVKQHRVGSVHRRSGSLPIFNPSLLSVLSTLTSTSANSSNSSATITQYSYDRASKNNKSEGSKREGPGDSESESSTKRVEVHNVFEYLDTTMKDGQDSHSIHSSSSSSSRYQASDAGSSELPETPSSHSTCPSPTATKSRSITGSVAELRRKYDSRYASSVDSRSSRSESPGSERSGPRSVKKLPQLRGVAESDEHESDQGLSLSHAVYEARRRSASHSYAAQLPPPQQQQTHDERWKAQQDALRQHVAQDQHPHAHHRTDSAYGQHRSHSSSSTRSADSHRAWAQHLHGMQMQHYQPYPSSAVPPSYPVGYPGTNSHIAPPAAPDAPDNTKQTIVGYELLAQELSNHHHHPLSTGIKPIYRRFEYLNHRILLHMQDELQELEEQLRRADEIIAASDFSLPSESDDRSSSSSPPPAAPASRRNDRNYGSHFHHQRTELLGRIFLKTKDYNSAVASFANMSTLLMKGDSAPAVAQNDVERYREWLRERDVICEVERKFLDVGREDLVDLSTSGGGGERKRRSASGTAEEADGMAMMTALDCQHLMWAGGAVLPLLPMVLFSLISTLAGRVVVTALLTVATLLIASGSRTISTQLAGTFNLKPRQRYLGIAGYMLVCCGFAACVPLR